SLPIRFPGYDRNSFLASFMTLHSFDIPLLRAALWTEEPLEASWPEGLEAASGAPDVAFVPAIQRRRLGRLAKGMLHCAHRLCPEPGDRRTVFASRHGELERTVTILNDLATGTELSPTLFSLSVHNAVAGLWSILQGNHGPSTALAAGTSTFGWGILDAFFALNQSPHEPVLYVFGEDRIPELYQPFLPGNEPAHAMAFLVGRPAAFTLTVTWNDEPQSDLSSEAQSLHFLQSLTCAESLPWRGREGAWNWHVG
ncbi:MAG: beta-ketoacyl synthase chain length factor, partial [Firmicutes bacterium]|nr:beta-ketoacyl synthase chain length factor [Bacillota bacterium]